MTTGAGAPLAHRQKRILGGIDVESPTIRTALRLSFWDGLSSTVMVALTETFGIAAAVALGAPSMAIAVLGSAPVFFGSLGQYFLPAFVDFAGGRKRYVLVGVALQCILLFAAAFTGFLLPAYAPWAYVGCVVLAGVSANVVTALWVSWMGDLVKKEDRARSFSWRGRWFAWVNLSCALVAGLFAADFSTHNAPWAFFTAIFAAAAAARLCSYLLLKRQYEPAPAQETGRRSWRAHTSRDFKTFSAANALIQGATAIAGPFFAVYFLRDLHFTYFMIAATSCAAIAGSIVSLPLWGALADRAGNRATIRLSGFLVCLVPVPYLFFTNPWTVCLLNFWSGISWAGYNLSSFNKLLGASEREDRTKAIAFAAALTGVAVFAFTLLGGFLAPRLPTLFLWPLQTLFLISSVLRLLTYVAFFPRLKQYTPPSGEKAEDLFNELPGVRAGLGLLRVFFRALRGGD
jgi:MFS family permease